MKQASLYLLVFCFPCVLVAEETDILENSDSQKKELLSAPHIEEIQAEEVVGEIAEAVLLTIPKVDGEVTEKLGIQEELSEVISDTDDSEESAGEERSKINITSPWPAKPIQDSPEGWELIPAPDTLPEYKSTVILSNGEEVNVSMAPFVLMPKQDGKLSFQIHEPGFQASQAFKQQDTIGVLLESSTQQLEEKEKQAAAAINNLQQLLSSLPK